MRASSLVLLVVLFLLPCLALSQESRTLETLLADLVTELAQRFPEVSGEVLRVDAEQIHLSVGTQDGISAGIQLQLFREGETLRHPTTGVVLGRVEEDLGTLTAVQVFADHTVARRVDATDARPIRGGDRVRISAGRLAVGLLPMTGRVGAAVPAPEVAFQLEQALDASGRFRSLSADRARVWLLQQGLPVDTPPAPTRFPDLARALQVAYVLAPRVKEVEGKAVLELQLFSPFQATPLTTPSAVLPDAALVQPAPPAPLPVPPAAQAQPVPTPRLEARPTHHLAWLFQEPRQVQPGTLQWNFTDTFTEITRTSELLYGLDAADVDADNHVEVALLTATRVLLYRLQNGALTPLATFVPAPRGTLLSVQLLRLGDAIGLVVNRDLPGTGMDAFVLLLQGQQLVLWREHWPAILLAVDDNGDGVKESVWSQPFDRQLFFRRGVVQPWRAADGGLASQAPREVPPPFRTTGAAWAQLDAGGPRELVFVDERQQVRVYAAQEELWRSPPGVGGSYATATLVRFLTNGEAQRTSVFFETIPAVLDSDGDGAEEVLLARNLTRLPVFSFDTIIPHPTHLAPGDIVLLRHQEDRFTLVPISPRFAGVVSGLAVLPGRPPGVLVAISRRQGFLGHREETILFQGHIPPAAP